MHQMNQDLSENDSFIFCINYPSINPPHFTRNTVYITKWTRTLYPWGYWKRKSEEKIGWVMKGISFPQTWLVRER